VAAICRIRLRNRNTDKTDSRAANIFLNIHGGLVPKYRNVHSEFWALKNNEPHEIGSSIIYLDSGVDTGDLAIQEKIDVSDTTSVMRATVANLKVAARLAVKAAHLLESGQLPRLRQSELNGPAGFFQTPGFLALVPVWFTGHPQINEAVDA
jgi:hypothetical protein